MAKIHPGANLHPGAKKLPHLGRWSKFTLGCIFAPGCISLKHRLHDQNTPPVVNLHPGCI